MFHHFPGTFHHIFCSRSLPRYAHISIPDLPDSFRFRLLGLLALRESIAWLLPAWSAWLSPTQGILAYFWYTILIQRKIALDIFGSPQHNKFRAYLCVWIHIYKMLGVGHSHPPAPLVFFQGLLCRWSLAPGRIQRWDTNPYSNRMDTPQERFYEVKKAVTWCFLG